MHTHIIAWNSIGFHHPCTDSAVIRLESARAVWLLPSGVNEDKEVQLRSRTKRKLNLGLGRSCTLFLEGGVCTATNKRGYANDNVCRNRQTSILLQRVKRSWAGSITTNAQRCFFCAYKACRLDVEGVLPEQRAQFGNRQKLLHDAFICPAALNGIY